MGNGVARNMKPADAPHGPVARYIARAVRRFAIGDEQTTGGALGCDVASPRLEGWLEQARIPTRDLSRFIESATKFARASPADLRSEASQRTKAENRRTRDSLIRLFAEIAMTGRPCLEGNRDGGELPITKAYLIEQALEYLRNPWEELEAGELAQELLDEGLNPDLLPSAKTLADEKHWFGGWTVEQMTTLPDPESGT